MKGFLVVSIVLLVISFKLLKDTGMDLADVTVASDFIVGLHTSADEKNCRSGGPLVMAQDLDVQSLRNMLLVNIIACVVAIALLQFKFISC